MKLFQFVCSSNQEIVGLRNSFWAETLKLKSIYFMASDDVVDDVLQVNIEFLNESTNVHTSLKSDNVILPLSTEAGKRKHKKHFDVQYSGINIPQQTTITCLDKDGEPFDETKFGTLVITMEADGE